MEEPPCPERALAAYVDDAVKGRQTEDGRVIRYSTEYAGTVV